MMNRKPARQTKQRQLQTKNLEESTRKMEDKLGELKRQIQQQKKMRSEMGLDSTVTRWQKTTKAPTGNLKSYAKQILEEQKQAHQQFGINHKKIYGTKTFEGVLKKIKSEKQQQEERNPTKITTFLKQPSREESPPKVIQENNFFKAKMDVKSLIKQKTLEEFLEENFILTYLAKFNEQGINDLEGLRYVSKERLGQMGVKAGHQVKIIKKIKEQFDKMLAGKYQQPKEEKPAEKVQSGYGGGDVNSYNEPQKLEYQQNQIESSPEKVQISNIQLESNIKDEEQQSYEQQQQDVVMITAPMQSIQLQVNQQQRFNCYQCYKIILYPQLSYEEKHFCSSHCMEKFMLQLRKTCPACGKTFIKTSGYRQQGLWFCSLGCCPNNQEIQELFLAWHQGKQ